MDESESYIEILNNIFESLKDNEIKSLSNLADPKLIKDILLEMEPDFEKLTEPLNFIQQDEGNFCVKRKNLTLIQACLEKYLATHDSRSFFKKELNLDELFQITKMIEGLHSQLILFCELIFVLSSISHNKDLYIDKVIELNETLENEYLGIMDKYIDFSQCPEQEIANALQSQQNSNESSPQANKRTTRGSIMFRKMSFFDPEAKKKQLKDMERERAVAMESAIELEDRLSCLQLKNQELENQNLELRRGFDDMHRELDLMKLSQENTFLAKEELMKKELQISALKEEISAKNEVTDDMIRDHNAKLKEMLDENGTLRQKIFEQSITIKEMTSLKEEKEKLRNKIKELTLFKDRQGDYDSIKAELKLKAKELEQINKAREEDTMNLSRLFKEIMQEKNKTKLTEGKISELEAEIEGLKNERSNLELLLEGKKEEITNLDRKMTTALTFCDLKGFDPDQEIDKISEKSNDDSKSVDSNVVETQVSEADEGKTLEEYKSQAKKDFSQIKYLEKDLSDMIVERNALLNKCSNYRKEIEKLQANQNGFSNLTAVKAGKIDYSSVKSKFEGVIVHLTGVEYLFDDDTSDKFILHRIADSFANKCSVCSGEEFEIERQYSSTFKSLQIHSQNGLEIRKKRNKNVSFSNESLNSENTYNPKEEITKKSLKNLDVVLVIRNVMSFSLLNEVIPKENKVFSKACEIEIFGINKKKKTSIPSQEVPDLPEIHERNDHRLIEEKSSGVDDPLVTPHKPLLKPDIINNGLSEDIHVMSPLTSQSHFFPQNPASENFQGYCPCLYYYYPYYQLPHDYNGNGQDPRRKYSGNNIPQQREKQLNFNTSAAQHGDKVDQNGEVKLPETYQAVTEELAQSRIFIQNLEHENEELKHRLFDVKNHLTEDFHASQDEKFLKRQKFIEAEKLRTNARKILIGNNSLKNIKSINLEKLDQLRDNSVEKLERIHSLYENNSASEQKLISATYRPSLKNQGEQRTLQEKIDNIKKERIDRNNVKSSENLLFKNTFRGLRNTLQENKTVFGEGDIQSKIRKFASYIQGDESARESSSPEKNLILNKNNSRETFTGFNAEGDGEEITTYKPNKLRQKSRESTVVNNDIEQENLEDVITSRGRLVTGLFDKRDRNNERKRTNSHGRSLERNESEFGQEAKKLSHTLMAEYDIKITDCGVVDFQNLQKKMFKAKNLRRSIEIELFKIPAVELSKELLAKKELLEADLFNINTDISNLQLILKTAK